MGSQYLQKLWQGAFSASAVSKQMPFLQQTVVLKKAGKKRFSRALSFLAFCLYYCGYSASWKNRPFGSIGSDAASLPSKIRPISSTGRIPCPISRSVEMMIRAIL